MNKTNSSAHATDLVDKAHACLLGGLIGDAMGTPSEGLEPTEIDRRFGWIDDFEGDGTDDTIMRDLLADAMIASDGYADADDWATQWRRQPSQVGGDKSHRFFASILHAAAKLRYGIIPRRFAAGHMPSSTAAMSIASVGIVNAGNPRAAASQAQEIASLVHGDENGFCQDGAIAIATATAAAMTGGASVERVLAAATSYIKAWSGAEMLDLIHKALTLARESGDYAEFRGHYHAQFRRAIACDSRETIPATLALIQLGQGDLTQTLCYAANFGRDTDTIACMAGSVVGALSGTAGLREDWNAKITRNSQRDQHELARTLVEIGSRKAAREIAAWRSLADINAALN